MRNGRASGAMWYGVWLLGAGLVAAFAGHGLHAGEAPRAESGPTADASPPVRLIFDTDMDTDCDDAGALAMLHALADRGEVDILATVVSSRYAWSAPCVEAINRYYGRPDLPIGVPKGAGADTRRGSRYARQIAEAHPTRLQTNDDAPNAVDVYREVLAGQPDGRVVVVTVGYSTNLRDLLAGGPDEHSPLCGLELARRKVRLWVCMGGGYPRGLRPGNWGNFLPDPDSIRTAAERWPTPIVFTGLGGRILTGERLLRTAAEDNPVRQAYELYLGDRTLRPSWDQVALLYAVRPGAPYWRVEEQGYNHIFENGTNEWRDEPDDPRHRLLFYRNSDVRDEVRETIEALMAHQPAASADKP